MKSRVRISVATAVLLLSGFLTCSVSFAQTREEKVRDDRARVEAEGYWIYNDLPKAFEQAKAENKPIIVVLRCIPCEECVKLDDELVDHDEKLRPLLDQFVRARQVSTNGLDLDLFQYDTDQSFAVFLLNADKTIYGRFGTRSHRTEWYGDVSLEGMARAMQAALSMHKNFDSYKASLAGKTGKPMEVASPEKYPSLKGKFTDALNYKGDVVKSCIHCHQIGEAQRSWYRDQGKPIPEKIFFPYPHPKVVGLTLDPEQRATVLEVQDGSPASKAGLLPGDSIDFMSGQPMLSIADVQWVLHNTAPSGGAVRLIVNRGGKKQTLSMDLGAGWRQKDDIAWRVSSWSLRRMCCGGIRFEPLEDAKRDELGIQKGKMAMLIKGLGRYGPHATARKSGFREGDVVIRFGGRDDLLTDSQLFYFGTNEFRPGEKVDVTFLRNGKTQTLKLPMQK